MITIKDYKKIFSKLKCSECGSKLEPSEKHEGSGGCRFPKCKKCNKTFGYIAIK